MRSADLSNVDLKSASTSKARFRWVALRNPGINDLKSFKVQSVYLQNNGMRDNLICGSVEMKSAVLGFAMCMRIIRRLSDR